MAYTTGSKALIRQLNRAAVLRVIKLEGPIARVNIARQLGLSGAAVTSIAGELERLGLIEQVAQAPSAGGRPANLLALNGAAAGVIGIKLTERHLAGVVSDLAGTVFGSDRVELSDVTPATVTRRVSDLASTLRASSLGGRRLLGLGVGLPGVIDAARGLCVDSPILGWREVPIADQLTTALELPVLVDNDVNTLAAAERLYGLGRVVDDFVTVTIGRGVGLGIVIDGRLHRGRLGGAGEFGHTPVDDAGPPCECGRRGCLEAFVADPALTRQARAAGILDATGDVERLTELADTGNIPARRIFAAAGQHLGRALAGLVNSLSPSLVIISGEGLRAQRHLEHDLRTELDRHLFPPLAGVPIAIDVWDEAKWARGAAALVLESFFSAGREGLSNGRGVDLASFVADAGLVADRA